MVSGARICILALTGRIRSRVGVWIGTVVVLSVVALVVALVMRFDGTRAWGRRRSHLRLGVGSGRPVSTRVRVRRIATLRSRVATVYFLVIGSLARVALDSLAGVAWRGCRRSRWH